MSGIAQNHWAIPATIKNIINADSPLLIPLSANTRCSIHAIPVVAQPAHSKGSYAFNLLDVYQFIYFTVLISYTYIFSI
jgi:hypothetical protein